MKDLLLAPQFWVAMILAVLVKHRASPTLSLSQSIITTLIAVGSAILFTAPVSEHLGLDRGQWQFAVAALIAMTFEHFARQVLDTTLVDLIRAWRGKNGK